jgi:hypothetical protein
MTARPLSPLPYYDIRPRPPSARDWGTFHKELAHHEAGHVIGHITTGHPFTLALVERVKTRHGFTHAGEVRFKTGEHYEWHADSIERNAARLSWLEDEVVITLAGAAADKRYAPRVVRADWRGSRGDVVQLNTGLKRLGIKGKGRAVAIREFEARAAAMIKKHWGEVKSIATALLERGTLTEYEARELIGRPRQGLFYK